MPAGILPPKRENPFQGISSRYLDPIHRDKPSYTMPEMPKYDTQRQWGGTMPRYMNEKREAGPRALPDTKDPLSGWREASEHRSLAMRSGVGGVESRYLEDAQEKGHPQVTGKDRVRKDKEQSTLELGWRGTHALNVRTTFDEIKRVHILRKKKMGSDFEQEEDAIERASKKKKMAARSLVMDYIKDRVGIEELSCSRHVSPTPQRTNKNSNTGDTPGGHNRRSNSATITRQRRTQSPWERHADPESFVGDKRWHAAGVSLEDFDTIHKTLTLKYQESARRTEIHRQEVVQGLKDAHTSEPYPRVATLALYYQIPKIQRDYHSDDDGENDGTSSTGRRSPSRGSSFNRSNSPAFGHSRFGANPSYNKNNSPGHQHGAARRNNNNSPFRSGSYLHQQQQQQHATSAATTPAANENASNSSATTDYKTTTQQQQQQPSHTRRYNIN